MSDPVVVYSHVRGWSFPRGLSRCYKPILYHEKPKSPADKALTVHFFLLFFLRYEILLPYSSPILRSLGGRFRAADSYHLTAVIPCYLQYDNLFQSKLISVHGFSGLYIYTKFYKGMSIMSDPLVVYSHVRKWSFPCGLSRCYEPIWNHHKHKSTADIHVALMFIFSFIFPMPWDITSL